MPIASDVVIGEGVVIHHRDLVNLYGCVIGAQSVIGPFVEIQCGVRIGARCKISSHSFLCEGVILEDEVFVGHGVMFTNDKTPQASVDGRMAGVGDWTVLRTRVRRGASVGSGVVIVGGVTIGAGARIGAGAVVTKDVPDGTLVAGVPARALRPGR